MNNENTTANVEVLWNEVGYYACKFAGMGTDCKKENVKKLGIHAIEIFAKNTAEAKDKRIAELEDKNKALEERVAELEKQLEGSNALCLERAHIEAYRHKVLRATDMMVREILNLNANAYTLLNKTKEG